MNDRHDLPPGHVLASRYTIKNTLGRGGFGITYLATDNNLQRAVAIKELLPPDFAMRIAGATVVPLNPGVQADLEWARGRFLDEARVLARFDHPNIIRVFDHFAENGTAYLVMPYIDGRSLNVVFQEHDKFNLDDLRKFLFPVLDGLREVHAHGILHRDIKPDNIYVTVQNVPVLLDFGAARRAIGARSCDVTTIATASYAPIEQMENAGNLGPWSDIYSFACVIHKAVTGALPPPAASRLRTDTYQPLARQFHNDIPRRVLAAVDWALLPQEQDRPQSIDEWVSALTEVTASPPPSIDQTRLHTPTARAPQPAPQPAAASTPPPRRLGDAQPVAAPPRRNTTVPWIAGGLVAVLAASGAVFLPGMPWSKKSKSKETAVQPEVKEAEAGSTEKHNETARQEHSDNAIPASGPNNGPSAENASAVKKEPPKDVASTSGGGQPKKEVTVVPPPSIPKEEPAPAPTPAPAPAPPAASSLAGSKAGEIRDFEIIKNVSVRFCWCPAGEFLMGNSPDETAILRPDLAHAAPQHKVTLSHGFWIAKYELSKAEVKAIDQALANGVTAPVQPGATPSGLPMDHISWNRAMEMCKSIRTHHPLDDWEVRLPTEAEWEYACRAGTTTAFSFGASLNGSLANCDGNHPYPTTMTPGLNLTQAVPGGSYPPNPWGICDLHGNLAEWCLDSYENSYPPEPVTDPRRTGTGANRVIRGGSWSTRASACRSAARSEGRPDLEDENLGVRFVIAAKGDQIVAKP